VFCNRNYPEATSSKRYGRGEPSRPTTHDENVRFDQIMTSQQSGLLIPLCNSLHAKRHIDLRSTLRSFDRATLNRQGGSDRTKGLDVSPSRRADPVKVFNFSKCRFHRRQTGRFFPEPESNDRPAAPIDRAADFPHQVPARGTS